MIKKVRNRLAVALVALLTCLGTAVVAAPSASAASGTISGTVDCTWGNNAEVGVWVDANTGTDGWASWSSNARGGIDYYYTLSQSSNYTLHVGCGGTPQDWDVSINTPNVGDQYYDWVCSYSPSYGFFCAMS